MSYQALIWITLACLVVHLAHLFYRARFINMIDRKLDRRFDELKQEIAAEREARIEHEQTHRAPWTVHKTKTA